MTDRQMENRVKKIKALEAQADALNAQADALKAEIKADLASRPTFGSRYEYNKHGVTVSWSEYTRKVFDSKAFCDKPSQRALYEAYKKDVKQRPFKCDYKAEARA